MIKNSSLLFSALIFAFLVFAHFSCKPSSPGVEEEASLASQQPDSIPGWPRGVHEVKIASSLDGTGQPALFWAPPTGLGPRPLLVALHTWSGDYLQDTSVPYLRWCAEKSWVFIHPDFRGPNNNPSAAGSLAATQDILDAVSFARDSAHVDSSRIYLAGASGGGHMALLTAGREPEIWAAVSAWVPVTDLAAWYAECLGREEGYARYSSDLAASCGGAPGDSGEVDSQYRLRSPLTVLGQAQGLPIEISAGIEDGHTGSVPVSHTLRAFNLLAETNGMPEKRLTREQIEFFVNSREVPQELKGEVENDPAYGERAVLFRRTAGPVRVTIFKGGHEIIYEAALAWLVAHSKPKN
ncbi:MAG TPA: prolyl oligopeptidase family serine peptidase [archaeon]|nr:prolyl oligopeptidase family serine peptidase [archaeon]